MARGLRILTPMLGPVLFLLVLSGDAPAGVPDILPADADSVAASPAPTNAAALVGAWAGRSTHSASAPTNAVEVVLAPGARPAEVVGQFTFLRGAHAWTARHEGLVVDGAVRFELTGGGAIVLRAEANGELTGAFHAPSGRLPAESGSLHLSRVR